jgi:hypothetical protein
MSLSHGARIVTDGLVLCLDAANPKSYPRSGTTWTDLSGLGNHGTLVNGPTYSATNAGGIVFDGANDYVDVAHNSSIDLPTAWTLAAWIYRGASGVQHSILEKYDWSNGKGGYSMRITATNILQAGITISLGGLSVNSILTISPSQWYYVVSTYSSSTTNVSIYINGALNNSSSSITGTVFPSTMSLKVGARGNDAGTPLNGKIANAQIYNRALSADEVRQNFNASRGRYGI